MTSASDDLVRFTAGAILRGEHQSKFLCSSCLAALTRERLGTTFTTGQIERALDAVFKAPGALKPMSRFVCDQCGKAVPCLGATATAR